MKEYAMSINKRPLKIFYLVVSAALLLSACSNSDTDVSDTGSIAFSIAWPSDVPRSAQALNDPSIDCDAFGIATISVNIYDDNGLRIKEASFLCSVGEGTVSDIAPGSNIEVYIYAKDGSGINLFLATVTGVSISPGAITDIGTVGLEEVDPNADSDVDGVTDDLDLCPNTPSSEQADTNGCSASQLDSDNDGVTDDQDECPNSPTLDIVDPDNGCSVLRFTDMGDGTIRDNDTGLIWLKNANCFGTMAWQEALDAAASLSSGECGLTDGSTAGDWRLPTKDELQGIGTDPQTTWSSGTPSVTWTMPEEPFTGVRPDSYWSSTELDSIDAWVLGMVVGYTDEIAQDGSDYDIVYVWPVRSDN
jgi:Protein of unknown function (DUF1566)/Thrombospondin type 3 repeat